MNTSLDEPTIPPRLQRPLAAAWISVGLHVAVIALVQVVPPTGMSVSESVIEARLVSAHAGPPAAETQPMPPNVETPEVPRKDAPILAPSETAEALPVTVPVAPPAVQPEPAAALAAQPSSGPAPSAASAPVQVAVIASSVDLTYYGTRDLDVQPRALREIVPDYPDEADRQQLSGKLRLQLKLEIDGRVSDIAVVSASSPGMFDESALRAFRDARFAPAQRNGRPVRAQVLIEVVYDWEGRR